MSARNASVTVFLSQAVMVNILLLMLRAGQGDAGHDREGPYGAPQGSAGGDQTHRQMAVTPQHAVSSLDSIPAFCSLAAQTLKLKPSLLEGPIRSLRRCACNPVCVHKPQLVS